MNYKGIIIGGVVICRVRGGGSHKIHCINVQ